MNELKVGSNRNFGIVFFIFFLIIALYPLSKNGDIRIWSIFISLFFLILGLFNSNFLTPLNKIWFRFGLLLGKIFSPLIMGLIYFLIVTPISLIMKLVAKDLLNLKFNKNKSYWIVKSGHKSSMKKQF